jgi:hypothetical protein
MAEEIIINTGVNLGDSPETIGNLRKEFVAARQEIYATTKGTDEYYIALKKAAEVKGEITLLNREIRLLNPEEKFKAIASIGTGMVGAFTAASGAITLFEGKNKALDEVLKRTQGAIALLSGLQAFQEGIRNAKAFINVMGLSKKITEAQARSTKALGTAQVEAAEGTKVATTATKGFGTALKATGIGLLISALAYLISNFDEVKKAVLGVFPGLANLGEVFDKVKAIIFGVGGAIIKAIITPFKVVMKLIHGDFSGALDELKDGLNVAKNFAQSSADETAKIAEEHRREALQKETEQTDKLIEIMDARGQDTYKIESDNWKKKLSLAEKGSKEYEEILQQQAVFEAKHLKDVDEANKKATEKAAELAKRQAEKMLELKKQYNELAEKLNKDLADAEALNSGGGAAVSHYQKALADIALMQQEEKTKLDGFLKSKVISIQQYHAELAKLNQDAEVKRKLAADERDKAIKEEQTKLAEQGMKALKESIAAKETALEEDYAKGKISKEQYENQLFALNTASLNKEKELLVKYGQDVSDIDKRLADNDIKIMLDAEKQKATLIAQANKKSIDDYKATTQQLINVDRESFSIRLKLEAAAYKTAISNTTLTEEQKTEIERQHAEARKEIARKELEAKQAIAKSAEGILMSAASALGKHTAAGKEAAIAATLVATYQSATAAFASQLLPGDPTSPVRGAIAAAAAVGSGIAKMKAIVAVKVPGHEGGGGGAVGGGSVGIEGGGGASAPSLGSAPIPTTNISNDSVNRISNATRQAPTSIEAHVVESNVTAAQNRVAGYRNASSI